MKNSDIANNGISQHEIAIQIAEKLELPIETVEKVIENEQMLTMEYVKLGHRVVKKNYLTIIPKTAEAKEFKCSLDGKIYNIPESIKIKIKAGEGFKTFVNENKKMEEKICRFVAEKN